MATDSRQQFVTALRSRFNREQDFQMYLGALDAVIDALLQHQRSTNQVEMLTMEQFSSAFTSLSRQDPIWRERANLLGDLTQVYLEKDIRKAETLARVMANLYYEAVPDSGWYPERPWPVSSGWSLDRKQTILPARNSQQAFRISLVVGWSRDLTGARQFCFCPQLLAGRREGV